MMKVAKAAMMKPVSNKTRLLAVLLGLFVTAGGGCHESVDLSADALREFVAEFAHEWAAAFLF